MSFNLGLSGLYAANKQMDVTGNNIANVATTGFKSSRAEFADVYSATKLGSGSKVTGNGVRLTDVAQQFTQGNVNSTGNVLDMGIQGQGFFVLSNNGSLSYTRAGTFKTDKEGFVTNTDGTSRLQCYGVNPAGKVVNGVLTDLRIDTSILAPKPTTSVSSTVNLNSTSTIIDDTVAAGKFDPNLPATFSKQFITQVFDTQGNQHTLDQYMVKTAGNTWKTYNLIDGRNLNGSAPTKTGAATDPVPSTLAFDASGKLVSVSTPNPPGPPTISSELKLSGWVPGKVTNGVWAANGAADSPVGISISLTKTTQFNSDSTRSVPAQDGYATGQLTNLSIDSSGLMLANFSNGDTKAIGQISLASFTNEQGLQPVGGSNWKETFASGIPGYDAPQTGTFGSVVSNSLEESNVNLTNELVNLIRAQSNYQANAKTISTENTLMQTIIQLK